MSTPTEPKKITPKMERPDQSLRVKTGVRAGPGGVTHTDTWRDGRR